MSSAAAGSLTPEEGPLTRINYVDLRVPQLQHWVPLEQSRLGAFGDLYASVYQGKEVIVKMLKEQHRAVPSRVAGFAKEVRITGLVQGVAGVVNAYGSGYDQNGNEFLVLGAPGEGRFRCQQRHGGVSRSERCTVSMGVHGFNDVCP